MIEVNGKTVGECLNYLVSLFPRIKGILYYETGEKLSLRSRVQVLVNGENADAIGLAKEVKDGDEIRIKIKMQ
jgi:molybdopterin converting factor small subunit